MNTDAELREPPDGQPIGASFVHALPEWADSAVLGQTRQRPSRKRTKMWLLSACLCLFGCLLTFDLLWHRAKAGTPPAAQVATTATMPHEETVAVVDVHGDVKHPGLYRLPATARVQDAILAAGGCLHPSDTNLVNMAAPVNDGEEIVIPMDNAFAHAQSALDNTTGSGPQDSAVPASVINLNTATLQSLETLPGIGPSKAQAILDYRAQHGAFQAVSELRRVHGIGPTTLVRVAPHLCVLAP